MGGRIDREHAGGITDAENLLSGELPVHITGERGEVRDLADVLFLVEHRLVQVGDGPAFRNIVLEQFGKLLVRFGGVGVLPGAERHEQLAVLVKGKIAVHHGGEADMSDSRELLTVCGFHILSHRRVCGLQTLPNLFLGVAPQTVLEVAGPTVIAGGNRMVGIIDKNGLDSGGTEFDAQTRFAGPNLFGSQRNLIVKFLLLRHSVKLLVSKRLHNHSVNRMLALTVNAHYFKRKLRTAQTRVSKKQTVNAIVRNSEPVPSPHSAPVHEITGREQPTINAAARDRSNCA